MNPKNNLNGFLVIDKPYDIGSTQVISVLKYYFHPSKIGHAGTLDPLATGVLPIAFGKATRLIPYVMGGKKIYQFTVRWGIETDSDDMAGKEIAKNNKIPTNEEIRSILPQFVGEIMQTPSVFSAIKVDGKRAYDLAREGKEVALKPRPVTIYDLKFLSAEKEEATFEVLCSKGTYVRSLAHDIAHALGTLGVVVMLRRVACEPFDLTQTVLLDDVKSGKVTEQNIPLLPMESVLENISSLIFSEVEVKRLSQGQRLSWYKLTCQNSEAQDGIYSIKVGEKICGLVRKNKNIISPEFIW